MSIVQVQAQLSTDELLKAAGQLSQTELEQFALQIVALRARRQAPSLPQGEAGLLFKINRGLPPAVQKRYDELVAKRRAESLTSDEYDELLRLTDQIENLEARRVEYLAELARLRQTSLTELMEDLGIRPPAYA
ncbi:MAG: STAS/SEC14 domain-containing protein [Chloroflexi bacterium]|nr:STAS/SEC14 domain-containing protein [Chloroflexota bacterium]